jgi:hypothetical protein
MKRLAVICALVLMISTPLLAQRRRSVEMQRGTLLHLRLACYTNRWFGQEITETINAVNAYQGALHPDLIRAVDRVEANRAVIDWIGTDPDCVPDSKLTFVYTRETAADISWSFGYLVYTHQFIQ